jgi:hypothetical protein
MTYKTYNNIGGWIAFGFSLVVYLLSVAPTASFWDCGEFIACANELQVPHPPGAPFFLILGRLFAMFSPDVETVAYMVNLISVLSSAFCVMFIFWTVTFLAKKMLHPNGETPSGQSMVAILLAGMVAALTTTFADSFWFNAVEAEVYAMSSFFTAAVVWLMFKWEARADEPDHLKWIVLIGLVMGISIGVHLLNLLTVPALAFIYYFKKFPFSWKGAILTFAISVFVLVFILYGVIQYSVEFAWWLEKFLSGTEEMGDGATATSRTGMGLPFGTGVVIFMTLVLGTITAVTAITQSDKWSRRFFDPAKQNVRVIINTVAWSLIMILIGYSSYTMILLRAQAGTSINENDPSSVSAMLSYLKREQYGDRPLFTGVRYNDLSPQNQILKEERRAFVNLSEARLLPDGDYLLDDGKSLKISGNKAQNFAGAANADGGSAYQGKLKDGRKISVDLKTLAVTRVDDRYLWNGYKQDVEYKRGHVLFPRMHSGQGGHYSGEYGYGSYTKKKGPSDSPFDDKPTTGDDLRFFLDYQIRHMYLRYFMWNFAGREGDVQDEGWESGLEFGKLAALPAELRDHQGKNHYYLLPLLLGLFGMVFQFLKNRKDAVSILLLFFFTGVAIIIYLNQTPYQPRERDYSYAGSFQTFAMWVGLGVIGLYELLRNVLKNFSGYASGILGLAMAPLLMGTQNWDDHSRHIRYVAPDSAYNLLNSCEKNAILFTNGDNDTFPLWYIQEVEGVRTDVRVVNLSLLNTDWYIDQMKKQQNESPPLPISARQVDYLGDINAIRGWQRGREVSLDVDKNGVLANGLVKPEFANLVLSPMKWAPAVRGSENRTYLLKQDWLIVDIMVNNARNGWDRPIYFSSTIPPSSYIGLQPFFQVEALANRVVPCNFESLPKIEDPYGRQGRIDPEISFEKIKSFRYTGLDNPDLYLDDHIRRTIVGNLASMIFRTANSFVATAENWENENRVLTSYLAANEGAAINRDSVQQIIDRNTPRIADYRKKGEEVLVFFEGHINDNVRGNDVVVPMFNGMVWQRLDRKDKARENYEKVLVKAEAWVKYRQERDVKLNEYDRIVGTASYIIGQARNMQDFDLAARAADIVFMDTGDPQYQQMSQQFRSLAPKEGTPAPDTVR